VLIDRVLTYLEELDHVDLVIDATLGLGGYAEQILSHFATASVLGIDQDQQAIEVATQRLSAFKQRFSATHGNFRSISSIAQERVGTASAVIFDLGVSNLQLSLAERGFSFQHDGPLDMRMDKSDSDSLTAWDVINTFEFRDMARIFREYGEERYAAKIASGLIRFRNNKGSINTTGELVSVIREILPAPLQRKMGGHPARKVFQALRIYVNQEISAIEEGLDGAFSCVADGGVIIAISYHSLEDRIVKHKFRAWFQNDLGKILTRKPVVPDENEIARNYKARSAKLRVFRKTQ
jgi:16S rRNA (cytosine1402-N4)-methyltransferase